MPRPVAGLVSESVYAMEWVDGAGVAAYMRQPSAINTEIVALGVDTYVKMLLADNFVHTDLHPGNIMVSRLPALETAGLARPGDGARAGSCAASGHGGAGAVVPAAAAAAAAGPRERARLVLLDFGLAEELTPEVRRRFVSFLNQIAAGDGAAAARHLLRWAAAQGCPDAGAFGKAMAALFERHADVRSKGGIDLDAVLQVGGWESCTGRAWGHTAWRAAPGARAN